MSIERDRLLSLIEFSQQSAKLRGKPAASVESHGSFALHEYELQGLPGIRLNITDPASEDEIWLAVERLHETKPPDVESPILLPWVQLTNGPTEEPRLLNAVDGAALIAAGTHSSSRKPPAQGKSAVDPDTTINLSAYEYESQVRAHFSTYITANWRPWAEEEKRRRKTIRLYSQLFTLKNQLEGSIVEAQLELVYGVGIGIWNCNETTLSYPLIGRLVELTLNPVTAEVEVRPRDVDARIEIDWYASVDNPGVRVFDKAAKEFFGKQDALTFSPFDRGTFEPLLRTAVTNLDANGIYWPNVTAPEDRTLPKPDNKLKVTDTWVLFARPRTNNVFLQDLEKLKKQAEEVDTYPPAVAAIVTDPDTSNPIIETRPFRGVSGSYHSDQNADSAKAQDLYFPKPFNEEQVRIVELLDVSDGVVTQGPPGTGKTHTIANVICHYLAQGKRLLVTSMKDPALGVLQAQLPEEIRPLAISLLTSEQDGMKQFEHAIFKIASEVQSLDRSSTTRDINHLEELIDGLHGKLATIDRKIAEWAKRNLTKVILEDEEIDPQDAAREVVQNAGQFEWIPDSLGIAREFAPQFSDADVVSLREARRLLAQDIDYLDASLPQLVEFPDSKTLLDLHQDLSRFEKLKESIEKGDVPVLANSTQETIIRAQELLSRIENLQRLRDEIASGENPWTVTLRRQLRANGSDNVLRLVEELGTELQEAIIARDTFFERPVTVPEGIELDPEIATALKNLAQGKSAFGWEGWFGKSAEKAQLERLRILNSPPATVEDWKYVKDYLALLRLLRDLALRWNRLVHELKLEMAVPENTPDGGLVAAQSYSLYAKVKNAVNAENEICAIATQVLPDWEHIRDVPDNPQRLSELEKFLRHHITKHQLGNVWAAKERFQAVLDGRTGPIIEVLNRFVSETLGNPKIEDTQMQTQWSALMGELSRVLGLGTRLLTVSRVCQAIESSGGRRYAELLKHPVDGIVDTLLPENWRKAWRLKRLATYLATTDAHDELKQLTKDRHDVENDLARAYGNVVVKRTWLKLAENASPSIRAALQAYLIAIRKIGKGTGKRAVRYRQDARTAASQANRAVPCWIMPHYRVSESLPAELGCFDLVVIDEASQSDLTALPSLLRAEKVLIVGDDKQVSPEGVGLEEEKIRNLMSRFLGNQVAVYRPQMSPERSIYDLYKVIFAKSSVMLKEHFRCVSPIIEYSKREFYNHELRPLRLPKASERLDPPLVDVFVQNGYRRGDTNLPEVRFIVDEIKKIVADPRMAKRSIGVVSLLADKQALAIWERLTDEIGPELMQRHQIACGDARTFQGKERDVMFLSMVSAPNDPGAPLSRDTFEQRFNVAASRARDRMYLVRSVGLEHLSAADKLRRSLIGHFAAPFTQDEDRVDDLRKLCESPFEREFYDELTQRGYWVTPQVRVGQYRIDMVVEGHNDARIAIECDGDKYHGIEKWADDMRRQRDLERAGWRFWRCFASSFIRRRQDVLEDILKTLAERGIEPIGPEGRPQSIHTEFRVSFGDLLNEGNVTGREAPFAVASSPARNSTTETLFPLPFPFRGIESASRQQKTGPSAQKELSSERAEHSASSTNFQWSRTPAAAMNFPTEKTRSSSPDSKSKIQQRPAGNPVVEGLAKLEERFKTPICSHCGGDAHLSVHTTGPVVVCGNPQCAKVERVDVKVLQWLAVNLQLTCRKCNSVNLDSVSGPFGNFLKCGECTENTSWQFVAGYSKKR